MVQLVNAVMIERRSRLLGVLLLMIFSGVLLVSLALFVRYRMADEIESQEAALIGDHTQLERKIRDVFVGLHAQVTAPRCSPQFQIQLRRFAFIPDGISEFFHLANGAIQCSTGTWHFAQPIALGPPDMLYGFNVQAWVNRDLSPYGLDGIFGTVVVQDDMGFLVSNDFAATAPAPAWLDFESVLIGPDGRHWHWSGREGAYDMVADGIEGPFQRITCGQGQRFCVASRAHTVLFVAGHKLELAFFALVVGGIAIALALFLKAAIKRYCSFENRFRRHLSAASIVCSYQPIMDLASGRIIGCEVLARWRDVDGSIVYPDRFIPLVERDGMTLEFTRAIVGKAMGELSARLPGDQPLQVAFNVFPADLSDTRLPEVFRACRAHGERFSIIAEIVESSAFTAEEARVQIDALKQEGVRVYLDDFGSGYSNIQNIAALPVEGVKLDRAFAMAPEDSLMAKMLAHAVDLIKVSQRVIVVEGVETAAKVEALRALGSAVDRLQGYHISRPLPIEAFAAFLLVDRDAAVASLPEAA